MSSALSDAIRTNGLGKRYRLGSRASYGMLREVLTAAARTSLQKLRRRANDGPGGEATHWALRDVTFALSHGEVLGIIGRNGSGKSTLLKILSRITEPTEGSAVVRGRVGSLLEAGTGFHPELTGRENIFVNGAILGMRRAEIVRRFDDIVNFSGVAPYLDTAVRHYSSGMQMRLAFAVAAHLEPHIMIVDEVLAVGDAEFQRRCLGKMREVSREGRTVLLVSHQMGQIRRLCDKVMWLDAGRIRKFGEPGETVRAYEAALMSRAPDAAQGLCFAGWTLGDDSHVIGRPAGAVVVRVYLTSRAVVTAGHLSITLLNQHDEVVAGWAFEPLTLAGTEGVIELRLAQLPVRPGSYRLVFALYDHGNNLTGGRELERWVGTPELGVDVAPVGHPQDALAGVLNVEATLSVGGGESATAGVGRAPASGEQW